MKSDVSPIIHRPVNTLFTIQLRASAAACPIVDGDELDQNTAMIIQILSKKDSLGVLKGSKS